MSLSKTINRNSADVTQITNDSTVIESVQMRISAAAETHILDRLTDLYSDPLAAALRESMSNAMDATLLLPKHQRRPIEVTSPTPVAPFLVVRDFAQGMSTATVREVYSQYGVSTKAQDFTQTGAFGLGSKAPLAYCSEFNVETVHGGVRTSFAISRQGSGFFTKIHAVEETADPSGTKITIPVLMDDIPALKTLITRYQKFPSAADIVVNGDTTYESPYIELEHAFELDEDSGTVGRVWVLKNSLARALELRNSDLSRYDRYFSYALSGWEYEVPDAPYSRRNDADALFVFELKPGLVDFASARDKITNNARSAALTALCRSFIGDRTSTAVERYLQIVDQLSRSELTTFIRSAVGNKLFIVADDGKTFTLNQHNDNTSYPISKLSAADGYNPLAYAVRKHTKNVYTGLRLGLGKGIMCLSNGEITGQNAIVSTAFLRTETISDGKQMLLDSLHLKRYSVAGILSRLALKSISPVTRVVIVVGVPSDKLIRGIISSRWRLAEQTEYSGSCLILFAQGPSVKPQLKDVREFTDLPVTITTVEELSELIKELKPTPIPKAQRKVRHLRLVTVTSGFKTEEDIETSTGGSFWLSNIEMDTIRANKGIVLLCSHDEWRATLIGAANNGMNVLNRPVYVASRSSSLVSAHAEHLAKLKNSVAASPSYGHRVEAISKLADGKRGSGKYFQSTVANASLDEFILALFRSYSAQKYFLKEAASRALSRKVPNKALADVFRVLATGEITEKFKEMEEEEIHALLDEKVVEAVEKLKEALPPRYGGSLETRLAQTVSYASSGFDEPIASAAVDAIVAKFISM